MMHEQRRALAEQALVAAEKAGLRVWQHLGATYPQVSERIGLAADKGKAQGQRLALPYLGQMIENPA